MRPVHVLIVGGSHVGAALAGALVRAGHAVSELDAGAGSPLARDVLTRAARGCDAIAAVTDDDAVNAVVALAARRRLHVPLAIALIGAPGRAEALSGLGIHVVCPTTHAAREVQLALVRTGIETELMLSGRIAVCRAPVPARLAGRTIGDLERAGELVLLAVERAGQALLAVPSLALAAGDVLHAATTDRDRLAELMRT